MRAIERFEGGMSFLQGLGTLLWVTWCYQRGIPFATGFKVWFAFSLVTTLIHYAPRMVVEAWRTRRHWRHSLILVTFIGGVPGVIWELMKYLRVPIDLKYAIMPAVGAVCMGVGLLWHVRQSRAWSLPSANTDELPAAPAHSGAIAPVDTV